MYYKLCKSLHLRTLQCMLKSHAYVQMFFTIPYCLDTHQASARNEFEKERRVHAKDWKNLRFLAYKRVAILSLKFPNFFLKMGKKTQLKI